MGKFSNRRFKTQFGCIDRLVDAPNGEYGLTCSSGGVIFEKGVTDESAEAAIARGWATEVIDGSDANGN